MNINRSSPTLKRTLVFFPARARSSSSRVIPASPLSWTTSEVNCDNPGLSGGSEAAPDPKTRLGHYLILFEIGFFQIQSNIVFKIHLNNSQIGNFTAVANRTRHGRNGQIRKRDGKRYSTGADSATP